MKHSTTRKIYITLLLSGHALVLNGGVAGLGMIGDAGYITNFDTLYAPILSDLGGEYIDVFDFHWYGSATGDYRLRDHQGGQDVLTYIRSVLLANNFPEDIPIWITEMGAYSGDPAPISRPPFTDPPPQTEREQAADYFKRFVFSLSRGIKKIFPAFGLMEGFNHDDRYFDHTGLIYDGEDSGDLGLGVKKLGYFTYKLMTEKLEGSDWDSVQTLLVGTDNVYAYQFTKEETGEPIYIAWWDWFNDSTYVEDDSIAVVLNVSDIDSVQITEIVPDAESGADLDENEYPGFFITQSNQVANGSVMITLRKIPVIIERTSSVVSVKDETGLIIPNDFYLAQNYPNPFNPVTTIEYQILHSNDVKLIIYNVLGQEVKTLVDRNKLAGSYSVKWDGKG